MEKQRGRAWATKSRPPANEQGGRERDTM